MMCVVIAFDGEAAYVAIVVRQVEALEQSTQRPLAIINRGRPCFHHNLLTP